MNLLTMLVVLPVVGAVIGYTTKSIAIQMVFRAGRRAPARAMARLPVTPWPRVPRGEWVPAYMEKSPRFEDVLIVVGDGLVRLAKVVRSPCVAEGDDPDIHRASHPCVTALGKL